MRAQHVNLEIIYELGGDETRRTYCKGQRSSRVIERECVEDVAI